MEPQELIDSGMWLLVTAVTAISDPEELRGAVDLALTRISKTSGVAFAAASVIRERLLIDG